jgi:transcriptional regulator with XRE-family HTH domain
MGRKAATATISDALRECLQARTVSLSRIATETGIVKSSLIRFLRAKTSLRLDKADLLAQYLRLEVVTRKEP